MKIIGITGGIASGKSTVTKILRDEGQVVIDADELAREVVAPWTFGLKCIVDIFGETILAGKTFATGFILAKTSFNQGGVWDVPRFC